MMGHNIHFKGVIWKIICKVSFLPLRIWSIANIKKKITLNYPKSAAIGFCSKGCKNKLETDVAN